jgi:hypothetical protein
MDRRKYLATVGTVSIGIIAGCSDDSGNSNGNTDSENSDNSNGNTDSDTYTDEANSYILSAEELSNILPNEYEEVSRRPPDSPAVGLESSEIIQFEAIDEEYEIELGVIVYDSVENAMAVYDDNYEEDEVDDENIGDAAYSITIGGESVIVAVVSNVMVQMLGTQDRTFLREVAKAQIDEITK